MDYLESKVKELFEQVLRGEKKIPKAIQDIRYTSGGSPYKYKLLTFSNRLSIWKSEFIRVYMENINKDKSHLLFKNEVIAQLRNKEFTLSKDHIELLDLFEKVYDYSLEHEHKDYIDEIFGELK